MRCIFGVHSRVLGTCIVLSVICLLLGLGTASRADTIIKLDLGALDPILDFTTGGELRTVNDGIAATTGDQNTNITFGGFLSSIPNITNSTASFTLGGFTAFAPTLQLGSLAIQNFGAGFLDLYDSANNLLWRAPLGPSTLTGEICPPGTAALFTSTATSVYRRIACIADCPRISVTVDKHDQCQWRCRTRGPIRHFAIFCG